MFQMTQLGNNNNEIGTISRVGNEYQIEIRLWDGGRCILRTVDCQRITHNVALVDAIGTVTVEDGLYRFWTVDDEEVILEVAARDLIWEPEE